MSSLSRILERQRIRRAKRDWEPQITYRSFPKVTPGGRFAQKCQTNWALRARTVYHGGASRKKRSKKSLNEGGMDIPPSLSDFSDHSCAKHPQCNHSCAKRPINKPLLREAPNTLTVLARKAPHGAIFGKGFVHKPRASKNVGASRKNVKSMGRFAQECSNKCWRSRKNI